MPQRLSRLLLAGLAILLLTQCTDRRPGAAPTRSPILLAVFAHPDDEASVGAVLAKYAAAGVKVHLAVATDGRLGVAAHAGIPAGDSLAATRGSELQCAAELLGLQPPVSFGLEDQLKMAEGLAAHAAQINELRARVSKLFVELQPDAIITWPASGWTGHPDHRIVSSVVTEVFQSQRWQRPARLYYPAVPVGRLPPSHPLSAAAMDPEFLGVEVAVSAADYDKAKQAWLCHRSQYTPEMIEQLQQSMLGTQQGVAHFHSLQPAADKATSLLPSSTR
jgi:LmbE family N-acetylglucosaminyl deacetylase